MPIKCQLLLSGSFLLHQARVWAPPKQDIICKNSCIPMAIILIVALGTGMRESSVCDGKEVHCRFQFDFHLILRSCFHYFDCLIGSSSTDTTNYQEQIKIEIFLLRPKKLRWSNWELEEENLGRVKHFFPRRELMLLTKSRRVDAVLPVNTTTVVLAW